MNNPKSTTLHVTTIPRRQNILFGYQSHKNRAHYLLVYTTFKRTNKLKNFGHQAFLKNGAPFSVFCTEVFNHIKFLTALNVSERMMVIAKSPRLYNCLAVETENNLLGLKDSADILHYTQEIKVLLAAHDVK